jgi:hypothetical protein
MKKRLMWTGFSSLMVLVVVLVIGSAYLFPAKAEPTATGGAPGTWAVGGGGSHMAYLVNTRTGEVWALNGIEKQPVVEVKAAPSR